MEREGWDFRRIDPSLLSPHCWNQPRCIFSTPHSVQPEISSLSEHRHTLWLTCHLLLKFPAYFQRGKWSLQLFWCFVSNLNTCSPRSAYRKRQVWSSRYRRFGPWWVLLRWFWFLSSWSIPKKYPHLNGGPLTFGFAESDVIIRIKNLGVYKGDI